MTGIELSFMNNFPFGNKILGGLPYLGHRLLKVYFTSTRAKKYGCEYFIITCLCGQWADSLPSIMSGLRFAKKMYEMGLLNTYTTASFEHLLMTSAVPYTFLKLLPPIKIHGCLDSPIRYIFYARLIHHCLVALWGCMNAFS